MNLNGVRQNVLDLMIALVYKFYIKISTICSLRGKDHQESQCAVCRLRG
jgi:hypothetical protein